MLSELVAFGNWLNLLNVLLIPIGIGAYKVSREVFAELRAVSDRLIVIETHLGIGPAQINLAGLRRRSMDK